MTVNSQRLLLAAAGAAAAGEGLYVDDVFSTYLYEGTSATQSIANGIDVDGEGGLVWIKCRDFGRGHRLFDTERGATKFVASNDNGSEVTDTATLTSFNSDGFTIGSDTQINFTGNDFVSWTFRKAPGFFDVVTYTGNSTQNRAISHSLGSTPGCIIVKDLSTRDWYVWHRSANPAWTGNTTEGDTTGGNSTGALVLNSTAAFNSSWGLFTYVNSTAFGVRFNNSDINYPGGNFVAYLFAHDDQSFGEDEDEAIIKCGSYNGGTAGQEISVGFEPQWLLVKRTNGARSWIVVDSMRPVCQTLSPNSNIAEVDDDGNWEPTANGFRLPVIQNDFNGTGMDYVYVAIRRPHKPPEAATDVFAVDVDSASSTIPTWDSGFPVDMAFALDTLGGAGAQKNSARLLGSKYLVTSASSAEASDGSLVWDSNEGWGKDYDVNRAYYSHMFRRAPGFFDVVTYTGTGSNRTVSHNLAAIPELIIVKSRNAAYDWRVYVSSEGAQEYLELNSTAASFGDSGASFGTTPTSSVFSVNTNYKTNESGTNFIAYLFATLPGISKVGSYTGTGSNIGVDCGFTAGARFVLIKRTDSTGDWYVYDSTRGIVGGNDPYLLFNSTAAEVTTTDYIDPLNSGFTVTSSAPAALNASGGTYIFLAIA